MSIARIVHRLQQTSNVLGHTIQKGSINRLELCTIPQLSYSTSSSYYTKQTQTKTITNKTEWTVIYRLPIIKWASAFNRLKLYQGAVSMAGIPAVSMLEVSELLPGGSGVTFATVGLTGLITLALSSLVVQNLIGFIYINQSGDKLKFAYVDYWGRRKDMVIDINELVPDGAQDKPTRFNFYQIIGIQSNEKFRMKLLQRYGVITDQNVFNAFFY